MADSFKTSPNNIPPTSTPGFTGDFVPHVFESESFNVLRLRGEDRELQRHIDSTLDRIERLRNILGEYGIALYSVIDEPDSLGVEKGHFTTACKHKPAGLLHDMAAEAAPNMPTLPTYYFWDDDNPLFTDQPPLPMVLKDTERHQGDGKLLIERTEQIEILRRWRDANQQLQGHVLRGLVTEPYIETPGGVNSSYRLITTATGQVIAAGLFYKPHIEGIHITNPIGAWGRMTPLAAANSEYFLQSREFRSNITQGGSIITLNVEAGDKPPQPDISDEAQHILKAHDIVDRRVPADIMHWSQQIGRLVGPKLALVMGIDFIQDLDNKRYNLELNTFPGVELLRAQWGLDRHVPVNDIYDRMHHIVGRGLDELRAARNS